MNKQQLQAANYYRAAERLESKGQKMPSHMTAAQLNALYVESNNSDIARAQANVRELNHEIMGWLESDNVDQAIFASKQVMHQLLMIEMYKNNIELLLKGSN